jgi:glycosyltransferase involved in cell wall biosynthesis
LPQLCTDYPVYRELNKIHNIGVLINELSSENIAAEINLLLDDDVKWNQLHRNCVAAAKKLNWQEEEITLIKFYKKIFG